MKKNILLYFFFLTPLCNSFGQGKVVLEGIYKGKKLYIQNLGASGQDTCAEKVMINNKEFTFKNERIFEINPASLGFSIGDSLKIIISHKAGCKPFVMVDNATPKRIFFIDTISIEQSGSH